MITRASQPLRCALLLPLLLTLLPAAASALRPRVEKAQVSLAADRTAYEPGETAQVAVLLDIEQGWHVNSHQPSFDYLIPTEAVFQLPEGWPPARVDYPPGDLATFAFADEALSVYDGQTTLLAHITVPISAPPGSTAEIVAAVTYQACDDSSCLPPVTAEAALTLAVGSGGAATEPSLFRGLAAGDGAAGPGPAGPGEGGSGGGPGLAVILLLALAGGLILNVMPCVLPVLSLKVFGLVKSAGEGRRAVTVGGLATAAGILASFLALAGAAVAAKLAGAAVGWGIQFQNPTFVTFLAVVVVLFCLNLWGLFEIQLPGALARVGGAGSREGAAGHFASGLFATLMATPCSAPFLGTALGFALGQTAPVILATFTAVGLGMALPYLALAAFPRAAFLLPKPGPWMVTLKGLMGFLLAAAVVWLLYVLAAQVSPVRLAAIELGLLALALFVWLRHRGLAGGAGRRLALAGTVGAIALTLGLALAAGEAEAKRGAEVTAAGGVEWVAWSRGRAEELAAAGRLVFVDVTADWCFTCKFNEKLVLSSAAVADAFARHEVVPMKADWTNRNDEIADYLASFDRYGIPFYALYRPGAEPYVFGELLTQEAVLAAVEEAGEKLARR